MRESATRLRYRPHRDLGFIGKRVVDLLLVLTELFSLVVMAEALNTSDCRFKNR